jgi:hypothetical protein
LTRRPGVVQKKYLQYQTAVIEQAGNPNPTRDHELN